MGLPEWCLCLPHTLMKAHAVSQNSWGDLSCWRAPRGKRFRCIYLSSVTYSTICHLLISAWEIMHVPLCEHACCVRVMHDAVWDSTLLDRSLRMFVLQQIKALHSKESFVHFHIHTFCHTVLDDLVLLKTITTFNLCKDLGDFYYCCWLKVNFILPETDKALRSSYELPYSVVAFPLLTSRIGMLCVMGNT